MRVYEGGEEMSKTIAPHGVFSIQNGVNELCLICAIASYNDTNIPSHEGKKATQLSLAQVGRRTNTYQYSKWKVDSVWGSTQPKIRVTSKKALNKSCSKLNFVQKSP